MDLLASWLELCARVGAGGDAPAVGGRLLAGYDGPDRAYHDTRHLTEVLTHVDALAAEAADADAVRLAAWFHDAVYDTHRPDNEERSALLAETALGQAGVDAARVAEVARLVRLTERHDPGPGDANGAVLCDADLAVLARDPHGYAAYAAAIRREYADVPDDSFRAGRAAILRALLDAPRLFRTATGAARWESTARANIAAEIAELEPGPSR
jgi:predicted metal-dependent HD superfamily phosphohydrolase